LQASCENGVLKVTLPKVKPVTPKGSSIAIADKHHA
jgi:HSP20 family molecular chaperone IbpA